MSLFNKNGKRRWFDRPGPHNKEQISEREIYSRKVYYLGRFITLTLLVIAIGIVKAMESGIWWVWVIILTICALIWVILDEKKRTIETKIAEIDQVSNTS